jgi:hypothetical protein
VRSFRGRQSWPAIRRPVDPHRLVLIELDRMMFVHLETVWLFANIGSIGWLETSIIVKSRSILPKFLSSGPSLLSDETVELGISPKENTTDRPGCTFFLVEIV